jgi:hypothetical protein
MLKHTSEKRSTMAETKEGRYEEAKEVGKNRGGEAHLLGLDLRLDSSKNDLGHILRERVRILASSVTDRLRARAMFHTRVCARAHDDWTHAK